MKVRNSLRSLKSRHRDCRVVRRKGRVYVINKTQRGSRPVRAETSATACKKAAPGSPARPFLCSVSL